MAKEKITVKSWAEADAALHMIGRIQVERQGLEANLNTKVQNLRENFQELTRDGIEEEKDLAKALEKFVKANQDDLDGRSRKLLWGTVALRTTPPRLVVKNIKNALAKLNELGGKWRAYIRVKEELDKDALEELSDGELKQVGLSRSQSEKFYAEPDLEKIANTG